MIFVWNVDNLNWKIAHFVWNIVNWTWKCNICCEGTGKVKFALFGVIDVDFSLTW